MLPVKLFVSYVTCLFSVYTLHGGSLLVIDVLFYLDRFVEITFLVIFVCIVYLI